MRKPERLTLAATVVVSVAALAACSLDQRGYDFSVPEYNVYPYAAGKWIDQNSDLEAQHYEFVDKREGFRPDEEFVVVYYLFNEYAGGFPLELRITDPTGKVVLTDEHRLTKQNEVYFRKVKAAELVAQGGAGVYHVAWLKNGTTDLAYDIGIGDPPPAVKNKRPEFH